MSGLLENLHKDLGFAEKGISQEQFSQSLATSPTLAKEIYGYTGLKQKGVTYEDFENSLGISTPSDYRVKVDNSVPESLYPVLQDPNSLSSIYANGKKIEGYQDPEGATRVTRKKGNFYEVVFPDGTTNTFLDTDNSNFFEEAKHFLGNTLVGTFSKGVLDVVGMGYGAALDIGQFLMSPQDAQGWDYFFNNSVRDFADDFEKRFSAQAINSVGYQKLVEEAQQADGFLEGAFNWFKKLGHAEYWYTEMGDGLESMLGFMVPGIALGQAMKSTKLVANAAKQLKVSEQVAGNVAKLGVAGTYMSALEAGMEAKETFREAYQQFLNEGVDEKEARRRASEYASEVFGLNFITLMVSNVIELGAINNAFTRNAKQALFSFAQASASESAQEAIQYGIQEEAGRFKTELYDPEKTGFFKTFDRGIKNSLENSWEALGHGDPEAISSAGIGFLMGGGASSVSSGYGALKWHRIGKPRAEELESKLIRSTEDMYKKRKDGEYRKWNGKKVVNSEAIANHYKNISDRVATGNAIKHFSNIRNYDAARALYGHQIADAVYNYKREGLSNDQISEILDASINKESYEALGKDNLLSFEEFKEAKDNALRVANEAFDKVFKDPSLQDNTNKFKQALFYNTVQQELVGSQIDEQQAEIDSIGDNPRTSEQKRRKNILTRRRNKLQKFKEALEEQYEKVSKEAKKDREFKNKAEVYNTLSEEMEKEGASKEDIVNRTAKKTGKSKEEVEKEYNEFDKLVKQEKEEQFQKDLASATHPDDFNTLANKYNTHPDALDRINEKRAKLLKEERDRVDSNQAIPKTVGEILDRYDGTTPLLKEADERAIDKEYQDTVGDPNFKYSQKFEDKLKDEFYQQAALQYFSNLKSSQTPGATDSFGSSGIKFEDLTGSEEAPDVTIPDGFREVEEGEVPPSEYTVINDYQGTGINITNAPKKKPPTPPTPPTDKTEDGSEPEGTDQQKDDHKKLSEKAKKEKIEAKQKELAEYRKQIRDILAPFSIRVQVLMEEEEGITRDEANTRVNNYLGDIDIEHKIKIDKAIRVVIEELNVLGVESPATPLKFSKEELAKVREEYKRTKFKGSISSNVVDNAKKAVKELSKKVVRLYDYAMGFGKSVIGIPTAYTQRSIDYSGPATVSIEFLAEDGALLAEKNILVDDLFGKNSKGINKDIGVEEVFELAGVTYEPGYTALLKEEHLLTTYGFNIRNTKNKKQLTAFPNIIGGDYAPPEQTRLGHDIMSTIAKVGDPIYLRIDLENDPWNVKKGIRESKGKGDLNENNISIQYIVYLNEDRTAIVPYNEEEFREGRITPVPVGRIPRINPEDWEGGRPIESKADIAYLRAHMWSEYQKDTEASWVDGPGTTISNISKLPIPHYGLNRELTSQELDTLDFNVAITPFNTPKETRTVEDLRWAKSEGRWKNLGTDSFRSETDVGKVAVFVGDKIEWLNTKKIKDVTIDGRPLINDIAEGIDSVIALARMGNTDEQIREAVKDEWKYLMGFGGDYGVVRFRSKAFTKDSKLKDGGVSETGGVGPEMFWNEKANQGRGALVTKVLQTDKNNKTVEVTKVITSGQEFVDVHNLGERMVQVDPKKINDKEYRRNWLRHTVTTSMARPRRVSTLGNGDNIYNSEFVLSASANRFTKESLIDSVEEEYDEAHKNADITESPAKSEDEIKTDLEDWDPSQSDPGRGGRDPKFKLGIEASPETFQEAMEWFQKMLPEVGITIDQQHVDDLFNAYKSGGRKILGVFLDGAVVLAEDAGGYTIRHEAFHAVFNLFLTPQQRKDVLADARKNYKLSDELTDLEVEEKLAERFETFKDSRELIQGKLKKSYPKLAAFFNRLYNFLFDQFHRVRDFLLNRRTVMGLFTQMERGSISRGKNFKEVYQKNLDNLSSNPYFKVGAWANKDAKRYSDLINGEIFDIFLKEKLKNSNFNSILESKDVKAGPLINEFLQDIETYINKYAASKGFRLLNKETSEYDAPVIEEIKAMVSGKRPDSDIFRGIVERGFAASRNIKLTRNNRTNSIDETDDIQEETTEAERWQVAVEQRNPIENVSARLIESFSGIILRDENGKPQYYRDVRMWKTYDPYNIHNILLHRLSDSLDERDMFKEFKEMIPEYPWMKDIVTMIFGERNKDGSKEITYENAVQSPTFRSIFVGIGSMRNVGFIRVVPQKDVGFMVANSARARLLDQLYTTAKSIFVSTVYENGEYVDKSVYDMETNTATDLAYYLRKGLGIEVSERLASEMLGNKEIIDELKEKVKPYVEENKNPYDKDTVMIPIFELIEKHDLGLEQRTFLNIHNKQQYNHLLNNNITQMINLIKSDPQAFAARRQNYVYHSKIPFYDDITGIAQHLSIKYIDGARYDGNKQYRQFDEIEVKATNLNVWKSKASELDGKSTVGRFAIPVFGDAINQAFLDLPLLKWKRKGRAAEGRSAIDKLYEMSEAEADRIEKVRELKELYGSTEFVHLDQNGEKFHVIPAFNPEFTKYGNWIDGDRAHNMAILEQYMEDQYNEYAFQMQRDGLVSVQDNKLVLGELLRNDITGSDIRNFYYSSYYYNAAVLSVFSGDLAHYKKNPEGFLTGIMLGKRQKQLHSPGSRGMHPNDSKFNALIFKDIKLPPTKTFVNDLKELFQGEEEINELEEFYAENDIGDAAGWHNLDRRKEIMNAHDKWTEKDEKAYQRLKQGKGTVEDIQNVTQIMKPFYYGLQSSPAHNLLIPVQIKNSEAVLIPQIAYLTNNGKVQLATADQTDFSMYKHPELARMLHALDNTNVDAVYFESAIKAEVFNVMPTMNEQGKIDLSALQNPGEADSWSVTLDNKFFNIQQNVPLKHEDAEILLAVQIRRMIFSDMDPDFEFRFDNKTYKGDEIRKLYEESIQRDVKELLKGLQERLNDPKEVQKFIEDMVDEKSLTPDFLEAIKVMADGKFALPLEFPKHGVRTQGYLNSLFKKVIKVKQKGASLANSSSLGFHDDLKIVFKRGKSGVEGIKHIEAAIPATHKYLLDFADENGVIDLQKLYDTGKIKDERILRGFFYRIPTEGKYSMVPIKVVEILPKSSGGIIILPKQITTYSGLDFDIDKLFGFFYNIDENGFVVESSLNTPEGRENLRLDMMLAVSQTREFAMDLLRGGSSKALKGKRLENGKFELIEKYGDEETSKIESTLSPANPRFQESLASRATVGGRLIGIFANAVSFHNLIQGRTRPDGTAVSLTLKDPIQIGKYTLKSFGEVMDLSKKNKISKNLSAPLFASTEHLKDPILDKYNIDESIAGIFSTLLALGLPIEESLEFITSKEIKAVLKFLKKNTDFNLIRAIDYFAGAIKEPKTALLSPENLDTASSLIRDALDLDNNPNFDSAASAARLNLEKFSKLAHISSDLLQITLATKADGANLGPDLHTINQFLLSVEELYRRTELGGIIKETGLKPLTIEGVRNFIPRITTDIKIVPSDTATGETMRFDFVMEPSGLTLVDTFIDVLVQEANSLKKYYSFFSTLTLDTVREISKHVRHGRITSDQVKLISDEVNTAQLQLTYPKELEDLYNNFPQKFLKLDVGNQHLEFKRRFVVNEKTGNLQFRNTIGLLPEDVDGIISGWEDFMDDFPQEAQELALYAYMMYGFRFSPGNFAHLVPTSFFTETKMGSGIRNAITTVESHPLANYQTLAERVIQNNFRRLVPSVPLKWYNVLKEDENTRMPLQIRVHPTIAVKYKTSKGAVNHTYLWINHQIPNKQGKTALLYRFSNKTGSYELQDTRWLEAGIKNYTDVLLTPKKVEKPVKSTAKVIVSQSTIGQDTDGSQPVSRELDSSLSITKIISGGQTGVDRIGLEVATEFNVPTGGRVPRGYKTEKGTDLSLKGFNVTEDKSSSYTPRTEANVVSSDATVYFAADKNSAGLKATEGFAKKHGKPFLLNPTAQQLKKWLRDNNIKTLNVAGNRASKLTETQQQNIRNLLRTALEKPVVQSGPQAGTISMDALLKINPIGEDGNPINPGDAGFANLSDIDKKRKKTDGKLRKLLLEYIDMMGLDLQSMAKYNQWAKANYGQTLDAQGFADMFKGIIAVAEGADGVTLSEEVWHFIVEMMWGTRPMNALINAKTETGQYALRETELWKRESGMYSQLYNGDLVKVQKEIIAKLLAQYTYDEFKSERPHNKIIKWIEKFLSFFFKKFRENANSVKFHKDLDGILGRLVTDFRNKDLAIREFQQREGKPIFAESSWSEKKIRETVLNLKTKLKLLEEKAVGLIGREMKREAVALSEKYGTRELSEVLKMLDELKNKKDNLSISQKEELKRFVEIIKQYELDKKNIKQIEKLNDRINKLTETIRKKNFEGGIFMFFAGHDGKSGAMSDIQEIVDVINKIRDGQEELTLDKYYGIVQAFSLYRPIIQSVNDYYNAGNKFEELNDANNDMLKKVVSQLTDQVGFVDSFLRSSGKDAMKQEYAKWVEINPELENAIGAQDYIFQDISFLNLQFGTSMDAKEDIMGIFTNTLRNLVVGLRQKVNARGANLYAEIGDDLDAMGMEGLKKIQEVDADGKKSGYFLTPYKIWLFKKRREEAYNKIIEETENQSVKIFGRKVFIPRDSDAREAFWNGDNLVGIESSKLEGEMKNRNKLKRIYNKKWAQWYRLNTQDHPDVDNIIKKRRRELNGTQFKKWRAENISMLELPDGSFFEYKRGELSVPSTGENTTLPGTDTVVKSYDYSNPVYNTLTESERKVLDKLLEQTQNVKAKLNLTFSFELMHRLPQVSKSTSDVLWGRGRGSMDKIRESIASRADDEIYAERINGEIIERPPIRFTSMLEDPEQLTDDLFGSVMRYIDMGARFVEYNRVLPELQGMREVIRHSQVKKSTMFSSISNRWAKSPKEDSTISGRESNLDKKMTHLMETLLFGESMTKQMDDVTWMGVTFNPTKLSNTLARYIRNLNLLGNTPSQVTGLMMGSIDNVIEASIGKYNSWEDYKESKAEFVKNFGLIVKDFENPIAKNRITVAMRSMGLIDSVTDAFLDTNKNRAWRSLGQIINYGGWRAMDIALKSQAMMTTAMGIRKINGEWMTSSMFKDSGLDPSEWKKGEKLWSLIDAKDGKLIYGEGVTKEAIELWKNRSIVLASRLDTVPTEFDKGMAYTNIYARFLTIHMGWLYQQMGRAFKAKHFNYTTQEYEEGYFVAAYNAGMMNPLNWVTLFQDWHTYSATEREGIIRIAGMMAAFTAAYMLAYVVTAIANGDDDDNPFLQHMAYLSSRILLEQSARLSPSETWEYIQRPVAGLDKLNYFGIPIEVIGSFLREEEEV